jgi:hypothetical protein
LKPSLEDDVYQRENASLRDAAWVISPLRDARAQVDLLVALRRRYPATLSFSDIAPLNTRLVHQLGQAHQRIRPASAAVRKTIRALKESRHRLRRLADQPASPGRIRKGLRNIYGRAQVAYEAAKSDPTPASMHEWRKKTKCLCNAV